MENERYKIRRNCEGNMLYFDAKELVDLCLDLHILQGQKGNFIFVYRNAGIENPEGWYMEPYEDVIQDLMRDDEGIETCLEAVEEAGKTFRPSLNIELLDSMWLESGKEKEQS